LAIAAFNLGQHENAFWLQSACEGHFACRFPYSTKNKVFSQELDTLKYISYLFAGATLFIFEVSMQIIYTLKIKIKMSYI